MNTSRQVHARRSAVNKWDMDEEVIAEVRRVVGDSAQRTFHVQSNRRSCNNWSRSDTTLMDVCGTGPIVAARILGEVGDVRRFPTEATFAAANGTAPIAASSGRT